MATAAPRPTRDLPLGADSGTRDQSKGETFALGAATGLSSQLGVGFGPTLSALAEAGWSRRLLLQLGLDYLPSRTHAAREGSVRLWLTSARAGIKWRAWRFGATSLAPVVLYQGGLITARGVAIADRQTTRDDFHAFGAKLALDVALDSWELGLSAGGSVLAKMHSFSAEYGKSRLELHELPRWSGSVEASGKFWLF